MGDEQELMRDDREAVDRERLERLRKQIHAVPGLIGGSDGEEEMFLLAVAGLGGSY